MDVERFDALTRSLSVTPSRRGIVRAATGLAIGALAGLLHRSAAATDCTGGDYRCGSGAQATCCPFFNACCHSTGACCGPNQICYHGPNNVDVCQDSCRLNELHCGGDGECCPFFEGTCCGADRKICCGPNDICFRPGGGEAPFCMRKCDLGQVRCAQSGDCCPFGGVCCGEGERTCCQAGEFCDRQTGGPSACAGVCEDLFSRHCGGSGACCPLEQTCCGTECCAPGTVCVDNTRCHRKRKKRRRRRRRH